MTSPETRLQAVLMTPYEPQRKYGQDADGNFTYTETWPAYCARRTREVCAQVIRQRHYAPMLEAQRLEQEAARLAAQREPQQVTPAPRQARRNGGRKKKRR